MKFKLLRFLVVGGLTFLIYFSAQFACTSAGMEPLAALAVAYIFAIIFHFFSNALYTFETEFSVALTPIRLLKYFGVNFLNFLINLVFGKISLLLDIPIQAGMVLGVFITTFGGFFFYSKYIFNGSQ